MEDWSQKCSSSNPSSSKGKIAKTQTLAVHLKANSCTEAKGERALLLVTISLASEGP